MVKCGKMPRLNDLDPRVADIWSRLSPRPRELGKVLGKLKYIREGDVIRYNPKTRKEKKRHLIQLGSVLLICKSLTENRYTVRWIIYLTERKMVAAVPDSSYKVPNVEFRVYSPINTFILFAKSHSDRDGWIESISSYCQS